MLLGGCHPAACTWPRVYGTEPVTELEAVDEEWPHAPIDIVYDTLGVPHVYAESDADLAFAQGFLHGRDRKTQLVLRRAFAWGRLTEIAGPDFLDSDRMTRLYTWNLDEEVARLRGNPEVEALLEAYAAGVNQGAEESGTTVEMQVVGMTQGVAGGLPFEPWTLEDSVAFNRAVSFNLVAGFPEELARQRILNRIPASDPARAELLETIGSLGAPVVSDVDNSGDPGDPLAAAPAIPRPEPPPLPRDHPAAGPRPRLQHALMRQLLGLPGTFPHTAGSNAWALAPALTEAGVAVLSHDPHLTHEGPSFLYLVHLEGPDGLVAAGASIAGVPGVVVGHGQHVAWGAPVSNADVQDLVRITPYDGRDDLYLLDARPQPYELVSQRFRLGPHETSEVVEEEWKITAFGPLLPPAFHHLFDEGEVYALMWPGFSHLGGVDGSPPRNDSSLSFWRMAHATSVEEASLAIDTMVTNTDSFVLADDQGHIAYRTSGHIPLRATSAPAGLPRDGRTSDAGWLARLPGAYKPQITDPASGIVVAANQRMVEPGSPRDDVIGEEGNLPYRAARIRERLNDLVEDGPVSTADLLAVQQDVTSVAARDLAPALARACPATLPTYETELVQEACDVLGAFDGTFTTDSPGAVVFRRLERVLRRRILTAHLGEEVALQVQGHHFVRFNVHRRILEEDAGTETALLDDPETARREGLVGFMEASLAEVLDSIVQDPALGPDPAQWRWGAVHTLHVEGPLAAVPGLGAFFKTGPTEETGCGTCVRAEAGQVSALSPEDPAAPLNPDAVFAGASFRMIAEMSDPPVVKMLIDSGQAGDFGHPHFEDQKAGWRTGTLDDLVELARPRAELEAAAEQRVRILAP